MEPKLARRSESGVPRDQGHQPVRTVVGFHVEGAPRSHEERGLLATDQLAASPSPVIIPTTFPVRSTAPVAELQGMCGRTERGLLHAERLTSAQRPAAPEHVPAEPQPRGE